MTDFNFQVDHCVYDTSHCYHICHGCKWGTIYCPICDMWVDVYEKPDGQLICGECGEKLEANAEGDN
jgi:hypothetical protein